jgi:hypothetical protein
MHTPTGQSHSRVEEETIEEKVLDRNNNLQEEEVGPSGDQKEQNKDKERNNDKQQDSSKEENNQGRG